MHFASWLARRGHQVDIVCERSEADAPKDCQLVTPARSLWLHCPWQRASRLQQLVGPDTLQRRVVHDTGYLLSSDVYHPLMGSRFHNELRQLRAFPALRALRHLHDSKIWQVARLQWHQMRHQRCLVACSARVRQDFARLGQSSRAVVANRIPLPAPREPASLQALRERLGASDRVLVLLTSNNHWLKGVANLLRSLALLDPASRSRLRVVITGHDPRARLDDHFARYDLGDCCLFTGWVEDVDAYYQAADVFFHPTYHDAGSLSTVKALAAGCAVATSSRDGSSDFIRDEHNGLILKHPEDPRYLAEVLQRLLNPEARAPLQAGATLLGAALDQQRSFEQLEQLHAELGAR